MATAYLRERHIRHTEALCNLTHRLQPKRLVQISPRQLVGLHRLRPPCYMLSQMIDFGVDIDRKHRGSTIVFPVGGSILVVGPDKE